MDVHRDDARRDGVCGTIGESGSSTITVIAAETSRDWTKEGPEA
jgi:hypothetical protein